MTKPQALPLALATALHAAAVLFLPKPPPFAAAADDDGRPLAWAWITPDVCFTLDGATVGAGDAPSTSDPGLAPIFAALRRGMAEGTNTRAAPELDARVAEALRLASPAGVALDAAALRTFAASLPAAVPYAGLPSPENHARRVTLAPVPVLRALAYGDQQLRARPTMLRDEGGTNRPAVVIEGAGWRAIVRGLPKRDAAQYPGAPCFDAAWPVALACAGCGKVASLHATDADALDAARLRRWQRRETDEGTVALCAPCNHAHAVAEGV